MRLRCVGARRDTQTDTTDTQSRHNSLYSGDQVALNCTEWDGMTRFAHLVFAKSAMQLPTVPALHPKTERSKDVAPEEMATPLIGGRGGSESRARADGR